MKREFEKAKLANAQVGVVSELPEKDITFQTRALENEYHQVFPVCVVTRSQEGLRFPTAKVEDRVFWTCLQLTWRTQSMLNGVVLTSCSC